MGLSSREKHEAVTTAFAVAQLKLQPYLPEDIEDVAIEALEKLVEKVRQIKQIEELKRLTASIAHNLAVSRLRERFAAKRGVGVTESLDARLDGEEVGFEKAAGNSALAELGQKELADLLGELQTGLNPEQRREEKKALLHGWRPWVIGLATAAALVAFLLVPMLIRSPGPIVQVAMLDLVGTTRGTNTVEVEILRQMWKESRVESFSSAAGLDVWEKQWPEQGRRPVVKVIYDRSAGEVRVAGSWKGQRFQRSFPLELDLQTALKKAASFIEDQTSTLGQKFMDIRVKLL